MIVINLAETATFIFKLLATIMIVSFAIGMCLVATGADLNKDDVIGWIADISAYAFIASLAGFVFMILIAIIYCIWRI